jgi:hypothetical protein
MSRVSEFSRSPYRNRATVLCSKRQKFDSPLVRVYIVLSASLTPFQTSDPGRVLVADRTDVLFHGEYTKVLLPQQPRSSCTFRRARYPRTHHDARDIMKPRKASHPVPEIHFHRGVWKIRSFPVNQVAVNLGETRSRSLRVYIPHTYI